MQKKVIKDSKVALSVTIICIFFIHWLVLNAKLSLWSSFWDNKVLIFFEINAGYPAPSKTLFPSANKGEINELKYLMYCVFFSNQGKITWEKLPFYCVLIFIWMATLKYVDIIISFRIWAHFRFQVKEVKNIM